MSYSQWQDQIKQIGDALIKVKNGKSTGKVLVKIVGKGAKVIVVLSFAYNVCNGGIVVDSEDAANELVWPAKDMIKLAAEQTGIKDFYDSVSDVPKQRTRATERLINEINTDPSSPNWNPNDVRPGSNSVKWPWFVKFLTR
ncbi:MAG: hypothetical protein LBU65_05245 [Planctomycetaceae bacterium]|jgi:hypothetical protein|nr:hypothetical protein [Planctomycetaceae bacterium]